MPLRLDHNGIIETLAPDDDVVALRGVTRVFGMAPGIIRVDLFVKRGDVVLVRGLNGSGKSTLLRVIATALSPSAGSGSVLGLDLIKEREQIRRRVTLLGHHTRLYEDLTASENLRFTCALHGIDSGMVANALERVGLSAAANERVGAFSHGMRQRAALARFFLSRSDLILLDEPYAGLDRDARQLVDQVISTARAESRTVILATHDRVPTNLINHAVLMQRGRLYDRPSEITSGSSA